MSQEHDGAPAPAYDDLLETALEKLDVYQAHRADMDKHLKTAFFNLAQAKQALGPSRVSPASYRHGRTEPLVTVDVRQGSSSSLADSEFAVQYATPAARPVGESRKGKERERTGIIDLRLSASTSAMTLGDEELKGSLRNRAIPTAVTAVDPEPDASLNEKSAPASAPTDSEARRRLFSQADKQDKELPDDAPPPYEDTVNEFLVDPIQQFSAFPPVTLRSAQREFRLALEKSMAVLLAQRQFESKCRVADEVHGGKK